MAYSFEDEVELAVPSCCTLIIGMLAKSPVPKLWPN
jgi:hypothetical protein